MVELETHGHLVDFTFDFALEDETDEELLYFCDLDVQLLEVMDQLSAFPKAHLSVLWPRMTAPVSCMG